MIFNKGGRKITKNFKLNGETLECVKTYTYLGFTFIPSGKFHETKKSLHKKGLKVIYK